MPTPDASAFTTQKKYNALNERGKPVNNGIKPITHLYSYVPTGSGLPDFLPSFSNKVVSPKLASVINVSNRPVKTRLTYYRPFYII
jgi:hypothetical protein